MKNQKNTDTYKDSVGFVAEVLSARLSNLFRCDIKGFKENIQKLPAEKDLSFMQRLFRPFTGLQTKESYLMKRMDLKQHKVLGLGMGDIKRVAAIVIEKDMRDQPDRYANTEKTEAQRKNFSIDNNDQRNQGTTAKLAARFGTPKFLKVEKDNKDVSDASTKRSASPTCVAEIPDSPEPPQPRSLGM